jgi:hypothetical protein
VRGSKKPSDLEVTTPLSTVVKDVIGVKDIIMIPPPPTSSSLSFSISSIVNEVRGREERKTLGASDIEHLEDSVIVNIVVRMSPIFTDLQLPKVEDFDDLPLAVVEHLKKIEEAKEIAERCFITDIRKKNPLLHVMAELKINKTLITLEKHLLSSFLQSFVIAMRKETREYVMERINKFDIGDDSNFDINSFKNLIFQTNYMVSNLNEYNDKEIFFGIFRLYKRNLYRFWYQVGMTLRYNLDYHWKKIMREMCKMVEDEELKKAMVDDGQKQLVEGIEKLIMLKQSKSNSSIKSKSKSKGNNNSNKSKGNSSSSSKKRRKKIYRVEEEEQPEEEEIVVEEKEKEEEEDDERVTNIVAEKVVEIAEVVSHTCDFATQYVMESLENLVQQNQEMRCRMNETYFAFLASPDTIFV